jgi:hypothetical protein
MVSIYGLLGILPTYLCLFLVSLRDQEHGEISVLREGAHEQGRMDQGGRPASGCLHQGPRRRVLAVAAQGGGAAAVRQELPPPVDQLPPARPKARQLHRRGGRHHHQAPPDPRKQV